MNIFQFFRLGQYHYRCWEHYTLSLQICQICLSTLTRCQRNTEEFGQSRDQTAGMNAVSGHLMLGERLWTLHFLLVATSLGLIHVVQQWLRQNFLMWTPSFWDEVIIAVDHVNRPLEWNDVSSQCLCGWLWSVNSRQNQQFSSHFKDFETKMCLRTFWATFIFWQILDIT